MEPHVPIMKLKISFSCLSILVFLQSPREKEIHCDKKDSFVGIHLVETFKTKKETKRCIWNSLSLTKIRVISLSLDLLTSKTVILEPVYLVAFSVPYLDLNRCTSWDTNHTFCWRLITLSSAHQEQNNIPTFTPYLHMEHNLKQLGSIIFIAQVKFLILAGIVSII